MTRVVITGGNRGIGRELARLYHDAGAEIVLGLRRPETGEGLPYRSIPLDVGDDVSVRRFADTLGDLPVDILINNAGIIGPERQSALDTDYSGFIDTLTINTVGPLRVTQSLLPNLRQSASSKVAIISSQMGSLSYAKSDRVAYRSSKAAVNKIAQCLATDLEEEGITVAAIHPGWVRTDLGGPSADIAPDESAQGVKLVIDRLSIAVSGRFWNYDGSELPW